jgi:hypothetical protein
MYRFCPQWLYNLHEFGKLDEIDSLLENSEAYVEILNSHRVHGRYTCMTCH